MKKWTITQEALNRFLAYLDPDPDRAGEKYEQTRHILMTFFRCNGCVHAEDLVDVTLDRVIRRLGEVCIRDFMPFVRGVARNVVSELHKKRHKEVPLDIMPEPVEKNLPDEEQEFLLDRQLECLEECSNRLSEEERELILAYYRYEKTPKIENKREMAEARGITVGALRVRAHRIRSRLQDCVMKCLETLQST